MTGRSSSRRQYVAPQKTGTPQTPVQRYSRPFPKVAEVPRQTDITIEQSAAPLSYDALNVPIMPKLTIGAVGDKYEQEADRVASQVVQQINNPPVPTAAVQREEDIQRSPLTQQIQRIPGYEDTEEAEVRMRPIVQLKGNALAGEAAPELEQSIQRERGKGQSLSEGIRQPMENAFGADFSGVKIHTDSTADQLNQSIQAKAFTTGQDVFFRQGAYAPESKGGQQLIAHELTHVVQQDKGLVNRETSGISSGFNTNTHLVENNANTSNSVIQRKTKRTEKSVLEQANNSDTLTDEQRDSLMDKMNDKDQTNKAARKIAAEIEAESETLLEMVPNDAGQRDRVRQAIKNYVTSSSAIQNDARGGDLSANVTELDYALQMIKQQINGGEKRRITYRSISYDNGVDNVPYGLNVNGYIINEGDFVGDLGFQSTSEHRQFVLGKEQTAAPPAIVKQAIYSYSGVPIAIHFPIHAYSNANKKAIYDMAENNKGKLTQAWNSVFGPGAQAGQAEILFARDTVFKVTKIERDDANNTVSVILEENRSVNRPNVVKNAKFGMPI